MSHCAKFSSCLAHNIYYFLLLFGMYYMAFIFKKVENWDSERLSDLLKITKEVSGGAESQSPGSWDAKVLSPPPFGLPNHQWSCQSWYEDSLLYGGICELAGMWSVTAFWFKKFLFHIRLFLIYCVSLRRTVKWFSYTYTYPELASSCPSPSPSLKYEFGAHFVVE